MVFGMNMSGSVGKWFTYPKEKKKQVLDKLSKINSDDVFANVFEFELSAYIDKDKMLRVSHTSIVLFKSVERFKANATIF